MLMIFRDRKRRWDQDNQENPPQEKIKEEGKDQTPSTIDVGEIVAKINASLVSKGVSIKPSNDDSSQLSSLDKTDTVNEEKKMAAPSEPSLSEALGIETVKKHKEIDDKKFTFIATIDVNDTKHRYYLTKPSTQEEVLTTFYCFVINCMDFSWK